MGHSRTQPAWSSLATLWTAGTLGSLSDGELLDHFQREPETTGQDAFRILVERHGAMVLGVCRSLLRDAHEAEDAFQATFLVLVRRADSIRRRETIAPWLHGVACRVARKARSRSARRRRREVAVEIDPPARPDSGVEGSATDQALQEEIQQLPESLRTPLILCCLEGQSYELAARRLGLRESTLRGRLHRARKTLDVRLRRRGILAPVVAGLEGSSIPPVPTSLIESTIRFAMRWSTFSGLVVEAGAVPGTIAALAQGAINAMLFQTIKVCGLATILTIGAVGTLVVARQEKTAPETPSDRPVTAEAGPQAPGAAPIPGRPEEGAKRLAAEDRTRQILRMLDDQVELDLPRDATLDQFLKAVKKTTTDTHHPGLPIYVDPLGLQEAGANMTDRADFLKKGTLRWVLRQSLRQWHLSYIVKDGFLMISSQSDITDQRLDALDKKFDHLLRSLERIERPRGDHPSEDRKP